ncbi:hypothetical protein LCGC14_0388120 [marine sediment metagenome]|uniref:Uncharacterized protein n=1 Tax=marine sediment metagenome TaxID=412755 RepID=A0A0F9T074_9ZZZZ
MIRTKTLHQVIAERDLEYESMIEPLDTHLKIIYLRELNRKKPITKTK